MLHITFRNSRSFIVLCVTNVDWRERSSCSMTVHDLTLLILHGEDSDEQLGTSPPSTLQSVTGALDCHLSWICKESDVRPAVCNHWGSPGICPLSFTNCCKQIFILPEWWQKCIDRDGDFVQKWIQCAYMIWRVMFFYAYLFLIVKLICDHQVPIE
jgi:hypothetical protein